MRRLVSFLVARLFQRPVRQILRRLVPEDLTGAWHRYLTFAIYVVGISGGVRIWSLEQYILLLVFFVFALIAYVRAHDLSTSRSTGAGDSRRTMHTRSGRSRPRSR